MDLGGCVYIITNKYNTTLYTGSSEDIARRMMEHIQKSYPMSFSARYNLSKLVYYECYTSIQEARTQEYYIKGKSRSWKFDLINSFNPVWKDLIKEVM